MGLETGDFIDDLDDNNPESSDKIRFGDDHLKLIKHVLKTTFPNIAGEVTPTHTELGYVSGVGNPIQTQLNGKAPSTHGHAATHITSGTLPVGRGGTGVTSSTGSGNTVRSSSPTFTGTISCNNLTASGTLGISSDERLKKNFMPVTKALGKIRQINGYTFQLRETPKHRHMGLSAQEVEKVAPETIGRDSRGMLSIAYGNLSGLFVEGMKELAAENDSLRSEVANLRGLVNGLWERENAPSE